MTDRAAPAARTAAPGSLAADLVRQIADTDRLIENCRRIRAAMVERLIDLGELPPADPLPPALRTPEPVAVQVRELPAAIAEDRRMRPRPGKPLAAELVRLASEHRAHTAPG